MTWLPKRFPHTKRHLDKRVRSHVFPQTILCVGSPFVSMSVGGDLHGLSSEQSMHNATGHCPGMQHKHALRLAVSWRSSRTLCCECIGGLR